MASLTDSQLRWRCRRGVRELDVLFTRFLENDYHSLDQTAQFEFQALLDVQDPTIMDWLFGKQEPEQELKSIISRLQKLNGIN